MAPQVGSGRLYAVEDDQILGLAAQVEELARDLLGLLVAVALRHIGGGIGVVLGRLVSGDVAALLWKGGLLVYMPEQTAVVLVAFVAPELLGGIVDGGDVEDDRPPVVHVGVVVALAALSRDDRSLAVDQEMSHVVARMGGELRAAAEPGPRRVRIVPRAPGVEVAHASEQIRERERLGSGG